MSKSINDKIIDATKWNALAEVISKLVAPITSIVLARLLTPEAFGVVTTLTMVISFAELFTDAGFQRYIVYRKFKDEKDKDETINVAFWSNLLLSLILWGIIAIFADQIAALVGSPGLGNVLIVACISIPLAAFSSIQMAVFRRSLDYKSLFYRRLLSTIIPLVITIPLAFWLRSYWALVIGTIAVNLCNAIILTVLSPWKPRLYYSWAKLKEMLSYSSWSLFDSILIWATTYIEIFFIGVMLSSYYLGIYKTSMTTVTQFTSIIAGLILPVLMPAFSRLQNNRGQLQELLFKSQKYLAVLLLPLGFGIFMFSKLLTEVLLGDQWTEAIPYIGIWGLMEVITVIINRICSNVFPAIGKPKVSVIVQISHLIFLIPAVYISIGYGFDALFYTRSLIRLQFVASYLIAIYICVKISPAKMLINIFPEFFSCIVMCIIAKLLLMINDDTIYSIIWVIVCAIVYLATLSLFKKDRNILLNMYQRFIKPYTKRIKILRH